MLRTNKCSVLVLLTASACFCASGWGAEIRLQPVGASGSHSFVGNEIVLQGGGQRVFLEVQISGWDPGMTGSPQLRAFQAVIESAGYTSGIRGTLTPALEPCATDDECTVAFGGACSLTGDACNVTADCPFPQFGELCGGPTCKFPPEVGGFCNPASILRGRGDYVFFNVPGGDLPIIDLTSLNYRFASATQDTAVSDPGGLLYAVSLALDVSADAMGTFTVELRPTPSTLLQDANAQFVTPLTISAAKITIACATPADCDDGSACTDDACTAGVCSNTTNFNTALQCCAPVGRVLTTIDDGNACTDDVCNTDTGTVTNDPSPDGTTCGNPASGACDAQDTCDGAGVCIDRLAVSGTTCGDPNATDCNLADTCDGVGVCQQNLPGLGTACGNPSDSECNGADTCDGAGACQDNIQPIGAVCGDPAVADCSGADTCDGVGACQSNDVAGGLPCGNQVGSQCDDPDTCDGSGACLPNFVLGGVACGNPGVTECDTPDTCDGAGGCDANPQPNGTLCTDDGNECRDDVCLAGVCSHPLSAPGTTCGSPTDTACDNPDTCDGAGSCAANREPSGVACGDPTATDCNLADTCDGVGGCKTNIQSAGSSCGDPTASDCNSADTCDAIGNCLANVAPVGLPCGNQVGNQCDNPDTCDAVGVCAPNFVLGGTTCGNPSNTECDNPDSCDGAGTCDTNREPDNTLCVDDGNQCRDDVCLAGVCAHPLSLAGTACGNPAATDCDDADTCDGSGTCLPNLALANAACGDPTIDVCTSADTCNGLGACFPNDAPEGTSCDDGSFCNAGATCLGGVCGGAAVIDCGDGLSCTLDTCNEGLLQCDHTLLAGSCLIGGACFLDGQFDPTSGCRVCDVLVSTTDWTPLLAGSLCDDGDACTGTGGPGIGVDICDPVGNCAGTVDPGCNDDCINAVEVFDGRNIGDNSNRGPDDDEASCQFDSDNDVWFFYTASCTGPVAMNTAGSQFAPSNDTVLTVYGACGGAELACNDDAGPGLTSLLSFDAVAGLTYFIRVAGFMDNTGPFVLNIATVTSCVIDGFCVAEGSLNPANECEACIPSLASTDWSSRAAGSTCGDSASSPCDSADSCDGAGVCEVNHKPDQTTCPDEGNDCTRNVCLAGACAHPPESLGAACGDLTATTCDAGDSCDGAGVCLVNFTPGGVPCGDPSTSDCDNADVCDGLGACDANNQADGLGCTDDGAECTADVCSVGLCVHPARLSGTLCGDSADTACDNPDTCDGQGSCSTNFEPGGFSCGNPATSECDQPDTCNGSGTCQPNFEPTGLACGSLTATDCDRADSCDGGGQCRVNFEIVGFPCGSPSSTQCDNADTCDGGGMCLRNFEPLGLTCGDPGTSECDNADSCDGGGLCAPNHQPDGLACADDGVQCTSDACFVGLCAHPPRPIGTACGDPLDTGCDNPDTCDATGVCLSNFEVTGFACGDPTSADCNNPDSCDGSGACQANFDPVGFACGDPTITGCDKADTCNGGGGCLSNFEIAGLPCGDPSNTQCDNPDTCNGSGGCQSNFVVAGIACGDPADTECDDPDRCDGGGACSLNHIADGTVCTDDGNDCRSDACAGGNCEHPALPLGTACGNVTDSTCDHPDTCDTAGVCLTNFETAGIACGDLSDDQCDHPDSCDGGGACAVNFEPNGTACDDTDICTTDDACQSGLCAAVNASDQPTVTPLGSRYLSITPLPAASVAPVALRVTSPDFPCLDWFVSATGRLVDAPVFQTPAAWGTRSVRSQDIAPNTRYSVQIECGTLATDAVTVRTAKYGDSVGFFQGASWTDADGIIDISDIVATLSRFSNNLGAPLLERVDLWPCLPDGIIDIQDIVHVLDAFAGGLYPCPPPCSPASTAGG